MKTTGELREAILQALYRFGADPQCIKGHQKKIGEKHPQMVFTVLLREEGKRRKLTGYLSEGEYEGEFYEGSLRKYHEWKNRNAQVNITHISIPEDPTYQVYVLTEREGTAREKSDKLRRDLVLLLKKIEEKIPKKKH